MQMASEGQNRGLATASGPKVPLVLGGWDATEKAEKEKAWGSTVCVTAV